MLAKRWLFALTALLAACSGGQTSRTSDTGSTTRPPDSVTRPVAANASDTVRPAGTATVQIFFIVLDGATRTERIGCGDGIVGVPVDAGGTAGPLRFALERLLGMRDARPAGIDAYNALKQTDLRIDSATVKDGEAIVGLSGKFSYGGVCDAPRIEAQLTRTATQFPTVRTASFSINGRPLKEHLSEK